MDKSHVADILSETAALLELKGENPFKIRAFEKGARVITSFEGDLSETAKAGKLTDIDGIGKGLAADITEILDTGKLKALDELKKDLPETLFELMKLPGIGPKKVRTLYQDLGITSIGELEYACSENRLVGLAGFGQKTQDKIQDAVTFYRQNQGKLLFSEALRQAQNALALVQKSDGITRVEITGEVRRLCEIINEIALIAAGEEKHLSHAAKTLAGTEKIKHENNTWSWQAKDGARFKLIGSSLENFGTELALTTGDETHVELIKKHLGSKKITCAEEEDFYQLLKLTMPAPEQREQNITPKPIGDLLDWKSLAGAFHVHTTASDGTGTLEEMVTEAARLGWQYIGISDHSGSAFYANGLKAEDIAKQCEQIAEVQKKFPQIKIFHGIESDILADGSLDYPEDILKKFDFVIASIHNRFGHDGKEITKRIITALKNPYTTMLGHMTGRLLLARAGADLDFDEIFKTAAKENKIIELNANPYRLDVDWRHLPRLQELGVKVSINPDAHSVGGLSDINYGIGIARKGGLGASDVFNAQSLEAVTKLLS